MVYGISLCDSTLGLLVEAWRGVLAPDASPVGQVVSCHLLRYQLEAERLEAFAESCPDEGDAKVVRAMASRIRAMLASSGFTGACGD